ncbi:MAG: hypothetical protein HYS51_00035 [Candidatus Zambryskibacteria bacterium]|nr:hypothetical protein [Candidatus Zambryskibacteria bacterium]
MPRPFLLERVTRNTILYPLGFVMAETLEEAAKKLGFVDFQVETKPRRQLSSGVYYLSELPEVTHFPATVIGEMERTHEDFGPKLPRSHQRIPWYEDIGSNS